MQEIELKLELDAEQEKRLRTSARVRALADGPAVTESLWSIYYDTSDLDLRNRGIALRLRRVGGDWVQTLKRASGPMAGGLSSPLEIEYPVASQKLDLTRITDHDLREEIIGLARAGLVPVAETRFRRTKRMLTLADGTAKAEFAIDKGTFGTGERAVAFTEAELELKHGSPAALYAFAQQILTTGPVRFATSSKSERALAATQGDYPRALRKARPLDLRNARTVEQGALVILNEGLAHTAPNLALVLDGDDINGPHQMRVGLRRLRSALAAFRPVLGRERLQDVSDRAQILATEAGKIRDLDVLAEEIIAKAITLDPTEHGYQSLLQVIRIRRASVKRTADAILGQTENALFPLNLASFLAHRAWVNGADHEQTARLAQPIFPFACKVLKKRWKEVSRFGDRIADLSIEERHEMRKAIKKLRYLVEAFRSLFDADEVAAFTRQVKRLQKAFGALNDSAMAEMVLMAGDAPGADDPVAQRAAGKIIGRLQAQSDALWPAAVQDWQALASQDPFWRRF